MVKGSQERADIRQLHLLDMMTHQSDTDNESNMNSSASQSSGRNQQLRRCSDGKNPSRSWSSPGSILKSSVTKDGSAVTSNQQTLVR
jgi:hypothetical protein